MQLKKEHDAAAAQLHAEHEQQLQILHALTENASGAEKAALEQLEEARKERGALEEKVDKLEAKNKEVYAALQAQSSEAAACQARLTVLEATPLEKKEPPADLAWTRVKEVRLWAHALHTPLVTPGRTQIGAEGVCSPARGADCLREAVQCADRCWASEHFYARAYARVCTWHKSQFT